MERKITHYVASLVLIVLLTSCNVAVINEKETLDNITKAVEEAYFEGQKDAINGDIRIKVTHDSCYVWTKSPWDSGKNPSFTPMICK